MWLLKLAAISLLTLCAFAQMKASIVILSVTDLNRAMEFYRGRLGLKLTSTNEDFAFFDAGGITIAVRGGRPEADAADLTSTEISFGVEHVKAAYQSLSKPASCSSVSRESSPALRGPPIFAIRRSCVVDCRARIA